MITDYVDMARVLQKFDLKAGSLLHSYRKLFQGSKLLCKLDVYYLKLHFRMQAGPSQVLHYKFILIRTSIWLYVQNFICSKDIFCC